MNLSNIVTRLKTKCGIVAIATPFVDINDSLITIIQEFVVPDFSIFNKYKMDVTLYTRDLERVEKTANSETYLLPEFKSKKLLDVYDVRYDTESLAGLGYYGGGMPLLHGGLTSQVMLANAGAHYMEWMIPKMTFKWQPPRMLTLYNIYSSSRIVVKCGFEHDKSLASIPDTARLDFLELAELEMMAHLWPTIQPYVNMPSVIGNIRMETIEKWANAEDSLKEYMEKHSDTYHLDEGPGIYYA